MLTNFRTNLNFFNFNYFLILFSSRLLLFLFVLSFTKINNFSNGSCIPTTLSDNHQVKPIFMCFLQGLLTSYYAKIGAIRQNKLHKRKTYFFINQRNIA